MARVWRQQAGTLLIIFVALDVLSVVYSRTAGGSPNANQPVAGQLTWLVLDGLLAWRIWRHGRVARAVLLFLKALLVLLVVIAAVWPWPPYLVGALVIDAAQAMLLVSPAIRDHVRARRSQASPGPA